ncbi:MAG: glycine--tRNA ligase [Candidatus Izemoplasmataceae bacterium]|jgi:glycyl-tRNA synthetase|uniref:glycine--tRNA ligase n=1 Tax=Liberiplasma polymorphum TaxID=3374570 RepID=UPI003770DD6C
MKITMEQLTNYAKNYGFVFQGSEIYGGLANTWDYGPLGVSLKNNIKKLWWQRFVQEDLNNVGLDSGILLNPLVWKASGHIDGFNDPLTDCKACQTRHRADHLIESFDKTIHADALSIAELEAFIKEHKIKCPNCGKHDFTSIRQFNLMFKTSQGVLDDQSQAIYLRPETAQGIFLNFKNVQRALRKKIPFGICQIGKSFRNEITPGNFIFRTREFEQMELEFFCKPGEEMGWFAYYKEASKQFLLDLQIEETHIRLRDHDAEQLSHYSNATTDIDYLYPWGFDELWGIASRTDYDLRQHQDFSKQSLEYLDPDTNEKYLPYVIEPSLGVERLFLALLFEAYNDETLEDGETRINLKLHPALAPFKIAVLPLIKKYHQEKATKLYASLSKYFECVYDDTGKIGKRYRRQDAIGTPFAVTIDDESLNEGTYTVRNRDTMEQIRLTEKELIRYIEDKIRF